MAQQFGEQTITIADVMDGPALVISPRAATGRTSTAVNPPSARSAAAA
ncbi:hypothetical protein [Nocardia cyriacigeorgica]|nr:hypothetical protein [Nocardia cyriacigeorgica]